MALELSPVKTTGNRLLPISAVFLLIVISSAVVGPWLSSYTVGGLEAARLLEPPSATHWMGTDGLGRGLLIRVLYGARVSLTVGLGTAALALMIGTTYGLIAGFKCGNWDHVIMRIVDLFYGLPDMLLFILLSLVFGRNVGGLLVALGLVSWVRFARITRGQALQAREFLFVEGARAMGASRSRIITRHILPNILGPIIVTLTFSIPS